MKEKLTKLFFNFEIRLTFIFNKVFFSINVIFKFYLEKILFVSFVVVMKEKRMEYINTK